MAVYTEVSDEDLEAFIAQYDLGEVVSYKGIAEGVENTNYLVQTTTGTFILTLYERRVAQRDLPFFLGLMEHLAGNGIACPTPIHGGDGEALRQLCGRPAVVVSFLQGMWPRRIRPHHCAGLGKAMAHMHMAGASYGLHRANDLSVAGWRPLYQQIEGRADEVKPGLADELGAELELLEKGWPQDLPTGIIHGDLFPDNVFFLADQLSGIIDFYFACDDFFAYDLAICLNAWCFEDDGSFNITKARQMLLSYREVRQFSAAELDALPLLARGSALRFLLTRLYDWLEHREGAWVKPKDPLEYLGKLHFHQGAKGAGDYGLD